MVKAAYHDFTSYRNLPKDAFFSDVFTPSASNPQIVQKS
jgi:CDP-4-dehydro-6-deoxyglucose reductase